MLFNYRSYAILSFFGLLTAFQAVARADHPVMLEITKQNCAACRQMEPLVQQLIAKGYSIRQVDADAKPELAERYGITAFPAFVVLTADGKLLDRIEGVYDGFILERHLQSALQQSRNIPTPPASTHAPGAVQLVSHVTPLSSPRPVDFQPLAQQPVAARQPVSDIPWLQATVRIRVENPNGHDWGTGTIIDARGGEALILTCGHIFRDSQGQGRIEVDLFHGNSPKRVPGVCLRYDADHLDLALVKIAPQFPVDVIPVAPPGIELREGMTLLGTGCDNGSNPTIRWHRVWSLTGTAPYSGAPFYYVKVDNAPVQGRSGGGLFTENGYLVGVCVAGHLDTDEGLFVPASMVRRELDNAKLSCVYQTPSITRSQSSPVVLAGAVIPTPVTPQSMMAQNMMSQPVRLPDATIDTAIRQPVFLAEIDKPNIIQPGFVANNQPVGMPIPPMSSVNNVPPPLSLRPSGFTETRLSDRETATLEELQRRQQEGDEIIVIVRSKRNPDQPCEIIQLSDVSPEFLGVLTGMTRP